MGCFESNEFFDYSVEVFNVEVAFFWVSSDSDLFRISDADGSSDFVDEFLDRQAEIEGDRLFVVVFPLFEEIDLTD